MYTIYQNNNQDRNPGQSQYAGHDIIDRPFAESENIIGKNGQYRCADGLNENFRRDVNMVPDRMDNRRPVI